MKKRNFKEEKKILKNSISEIINRYSGESNNLFIRNKICNEIRNKIFDKRFMGEIIDMTSDKDVFARKIKIGINIGDMIFTIDEYMRFLEKYMPE